MGSNRRRPGRLSILVVLLVVAATACDSTTPKPSATPNAPASTDGPPAKVVGDLALEACDPGAILRCEHQAVLLVEPVAATGLALTYSTEWADGRIDRPTWNASTLGLGGWSLDALQRYDPDRRILLSGDGSWRFAEAVDLGGGERAIPTDDGLRYFVFDGAWRHVRTIDSVTGATLLTATYDDAGRLLQVRGWRSEVPVEVTIERGPDGAARTLIGAGDARTTLGLDGDGRLGVIGRPDGTYLAIAYVRFGLVGSWQTLGRGTVRYDWDEAGRLAGSLDADGVKRQLVFSAGKDSTSIAVTAATGGTTTYRAERTGDIVRRTVSDASGAVTQLETSADGSTRLVEPDGTVTTTGAVPHPRWGAAAPIRSPRVETRSSGVEYRVETTTTMGTGSPVPSGGAWETVVTANGERLTDAYDASTRTLTRTDGSGRQATMTFDEQGRVVGQAIPGSPAVTFTYTSDARLGSITVGTGSAAATTSYQYDTNLGEVTATRPDGSTVKLRVDVFGRLSRASSADENLSFAIDPAGALLQLRPGSHPASSFGYSDAGRPTAYVPPAVGDDTWYELTTYAPSGLPATIGNPGGRTLELSYDNAGRTTSWTFDRGTSTASYDASSGLLANNAAPDGVTATFAYDASIPTGITWTGPVSGSVSRMVDGQLRPTGESVSGGQRLAFGYDAGGLLTSIGDARVERDPVSGLPTRVSLGAAVTTYAYDEAGRLASSMTTANGTQVVALNYRRDAVGRIIEMTRADAGGPATTMAVGYDGTGRLSRMVRGATATTYAYDASGNRLTVTRDGKVLARATYDDRDRILTFGKDAFTSAPDGPITVRTGATGRTTYDVDGLGTLRGAVLPDGTRIAYVIDAGGRRIGRKVDGKLTDGYLYDVDGRLVGWTDGTGRVVAQFGYDDASRLALVRRDGSNLLVVTDHVGSPIAVVDSASGAVLAQAAYDAWGNRTAGSLSALLPFGFAGGLADEATGLVHFGLRDYEPGTGRWTTPDPLRYEGGDINLFRYANGDPVNRADPTGTSSCAVAACASEAAQVLSLAGGARRGAGTAGRSGGTSGGRAAGPRGGYRDHGPSKPVREGGGSTFPTNDDVADGNGATLPPEHPIPEEYFPSDDDNAMPWQNCIGSNCRYVPGTNSGYCSGGDCIVRDRGGSYGWCTGWCVFGEPHLATADGGRIDFQAAGEFVIARSADASFEVQGRFEASPVVPTVTRVTAISMRVGGDRVAFYADPKRPLVVNGSPVERTDYATTLPGGAIVERHGSEGLVLWPDGSRLSVHLYGKFMDFTLLPADAVATSTVGLLGARDGNRDNDLQTRDGEVLDPASATFRDQVYGEFADSWRIGDAESLFDYLPGQSTATFQRHDVPGTIVTINDIDGAARARAEALCRAMGVTSDPILSTCIFDVGMTGDPTYAGSAAMVATGLARASAGDLELGAAVGRSERVAGELAAGSVARYRFTAAAGDIVYLDADADCGADVSWRLLRPDGGLTAFETACTDIGRRVLSIAGEWRIEVYAKDAAAGRYSFRVLTVPQPTLRPIAPGQSASGTTTAIGEWHRYTLDATAGQVVYLDALGSCDSPMSWRLLRPDGGLVSFETACTDMGRRELDVAGQWSVEVYSDDLDTGAYEFRVLAVPQVREATVAAGQTVTDATTQPGEWHRYRLTAKAGEVVYLDALGACADGLNWRLMRPDGSLSTFATTCVDMGRRVLDVAGDWSVEVYANALSVGAYSFRVLAVPGVQSTSMGLGQRVAGSIDEVGAWYRYAFDAKAGQRIVIDAQGDCVPELWWRLVRPDGYALTYGTTCTDSDLRTLDVAGTWAVEVYSDTMATGAYAFTVNAAP